MMHDQIEEEKRLCYGINKEISQLGELFGEDGAARREVGTKMRMFKKTEWSTDRSKDKFYPNTKDGDSQWKELCRENN